MTTTHEEIPTRFDFDTVQPRIYEMWESGGWFKADATSEKPPYTIVIPPPNVTGALHLGHALNNTLQDVMIRWKRMQGFNALWMPGTDHAGIATQARVEKRIKEIEGITRHDLGREKLVQRIWEWKDQYEKRILGQLKQMGCSCDWDRTRFTLDDICARAVRHTFYDLFQKSMIYRGKRLVNWDTFLQTTVSDDEVFSATKQGHFWHFMYPVVDPKPGEPAHITVATTRPETMLGDTAVAVHPDPDAALNKVASELREKLKKASASEKESVESQIEELAKRRETMMDQFELLRDMASDGRKLMLPLMNREIPLVCDEWAKPELGTGCVKITPAHDPNDYEVGIRCGLPMINIMNSDGTLNAEAGTYEGLSMKQARKKVVDDLEALGLLEKVEDREIEMPTSDRSKTPIEPFLTDQWFVRMDSLAQSAMDAVTDSKVSITPKRYEKGYLSWLGEKRDWPISRQLWWGHQIPVWSMPCPTEADSDEVITKIASVDSWDEKFAAIQIEQCEETDAAKREKLGLPFATAHVCILEEGHALESELEGIGMVRETDVLDTWFSSALWPHSTLGWPDQTDELKTFYPGSTLITSRDIITLWVARMVLMGLNNMGDVPFKDVFIHPKIMDAYGETMSKSKGNGIDPLDIIQKFGTDSLRYAMADLTTDTQDLKMPVQFECPHCEHRFDQTKKNRELPVVTCTNKNCGKLFSTQWAESDEDKAHPRGAVISERFETARNFVNKLWNASRFAMMNLDGYEAAPIDVADMTIEDRWLASQLYNVSKRVTEALDGFRYAEATGVLYDFAWNSFCSFFLEIVKDRLSDPAQRPHAQRMLVFGLDSLLRLLHPFIPYLTEEIWQILNGIAPKRGLDATEASECLIRAPWPQIDASFDSAEIESQFANFQTALGAIREIRAKQQLGPKKDIRFVIKCEASIRDSLQPMGSYFKSMAAAELIDIGPDVEAPKVNATLVRGDLELFVDLDGLIDIEAEKARLQKEKANVEKNIAGKKGKLSSEKFVSGAPEAIVQRERDGLAKLEEQLVSIEAALKTLG
jgi:valyl-tRNA synthetase